MRRQIKYIAGAASIVAGLFLIYVYVQIHGAEWNKFWGMIGGTLLISLGISLYLRRENFALKLSRVFVGLVFLYSGFVKAVDPLGSNYKFIDYFDAWGLHSLAPTALFLSFLLSMAEFVIGGLLLFKVLPRMGSWFALIFMVIFTPVTLYLAMQQQVSGHELVHDCGCFGDALILTNWQTFWKNVLLFVPSMVIFYWRNRETSRIGLRNQWILAGTMCVFSLVVSWYGLQHLPIIDFRPYKIGTHIPTAMAIPPGAKQPVYDTKLIYKKKASGEQQEFTLQNYPQDTLWEFVDSKNVLLEEGYTPPIHDFTMVGPDGDITQEVLADTGLVFMIVEYDLDKSDGDVQAELNAICNAAMKDGRRVLALTASLDEKIDSLKVKHDVHYNFYKTDPITLKTVVRSNPGLVLIKNGTVLMKWHHNDLPSYTQIIEKYSNKNGNKE